MKSTFLESLKQLLGESQLILGNTSAARPYLEESRRLQQGYCAAIALPNSTEQVSAIVKLCNQFAISMVIQGGNTGRMLGAFSDDARALIINLAKMNHIIELDVVNHSMTVQAGCVLDVIKQAAVDVDLFFPLSLGASGSCQIGGNIATNAGGMNTLRYGNTRELVLAVEAVLASGEILPMTCALHKNNTGYDLKQLLIGSEGTLAIITGAVLKLYPPERFDAQALLSVKSLTDGINLLNFAKTFFANRLSLFEVFPKIALDFIERIEGTTPPLVTSAPFIIWYQVADAEQSNGENDLEALNLAFLESALDKGLIEDACVAQSGQQNQQFLQIRERLVEVQERVSSQTQKFDIAFPISKVAASVDKIQDFSDSLAPKGILFYPFGHLGDGSLHANFLFFTDDPEQIAYYKKELADFIYQLVQEEGGSFSAEHGVGLRKRQLMAQYCDPISLKLMHQLKQAWDPQNRLNPNKLLPDALPLKANGTENAFGS